MTPTFNDPHLKITHVGLFSGVLADVLLQATQTVKQFSAALKVTAQVRVSILVDASVTPNAHGGVKDSRAARKRAAGATTATHTLQIYNGQISTTLKLWVGETILFFPKRNHGKLSPFCCGLSSLSPSTPPSFSTSTLNQKPQVPDRFNNNNNNNNNEL